MENKLSNYALYLTALIVCTFLSMYSATFSLICLFVVPMCVSYSIYTYNISTAVYPIVTSIVFNLICSFLMPTLTLEYASFTLVTLLVPGIIIGFCFKKKFNFNSTMLACLGFECILLLASFAVVKYVYKINITQTLRENLYFFYYEQVGTLTKLNPEFSQIVDTYQSEIITAIHTIIPGIIPFVAIVLIVIETALKYCLCKIFNTKLMISDSNFSDGFDKFNLPSLTGIVTLICVCISLLSDSNNTIMFATNVIMINLFLYYSVGISIIEFKLKEKNIVPIARVLIIVVTLIITIIFGLILPVVNLIYVFIFVGILDSIFDFRKLKNNKDDEDEK